MWAILLSAGGLSGGRRRRYTSAPFLADHGEDLRDDLGLPGAGDGVAAVDDEAGDAGEPYGAGLAYENDDLIAA